MPFHVHTVMEIDNVAQCRAVLPAVRGVQIVRVTRVSQDYLK